MWKSTFIRTKAGLLTILVISFLAPGCQKDKEVADFVFLNGAIYTLESPGRQVEALATRGERIVFTGTAEEAQTLIREGATQVVDLQGKVLMPGFTDAHVHPLTGGLALLGCDLTGIEDRDSMLVFIKNYAEAHPEKEWVRAHNFWLASFPNGAPRKEWLDEIVPDRPVYISASDGHNAWVNSRALQLAGISAETPDPLNGVIERDEDGEPTGTLREEAMPLVEKLIPEYTHEELIAGLRKGLQLANSLGITNLVEASAREEHLRAYLELAQKGELTAHVNLSLFADISKGTEGVRQVLALNEKYKKEAPTIPGERGDLAFDQVKLFMDGVVEGKTAAMLDNYHDDHHRGLPHAPPDTAVAVIAALDRAGQQIHVHAIGDRAIRITLDAFEQARKDNGIRDSRHHIAHLHVIHPDDIPRFGELEVMANFQALWATLEDSYMTDLNYPFLGDERVEWQYPIGAIARSGGRLVFGSDWDVSTMDPFDAMQVAVTRRGPDKVEREPWTPQHLVDVQTVVEGYAKGGAYLTFREEECGTLTPGKLADLIVLDRDVFQCQTFEIFETEVLMTMFRGKVVYGGWWD